jgi:GTP-binding protein
VLERQGDFQKMESHRGTTQVEFQIPARSLIGLRTRMLTATQGTAIMHHNFLDSRPVRSAAAGRDLGINRQQFTRHPNLSRRLRARRKA